MSLTIPAITIPVWIWFPIAVMCATVVLYCAFVGALFLLGLKEWIYCRFE